MSCWAHLFNPIKGGGMRYEHSLSAWSQGNPNGSNLCKGHLQEAFDQNLPVWLVIASTKDEQIVNAGNAATAKVSFHIRRDFIGQVVEFDGDRYVIEFLKMHTSPTIQR